MNRKEAIEVTGTCDGKGKSSLRKCCGGKVCAECGKCLFNKEQQIQSVGAETMTKKMEDDIGDTGYEKDTQIVSSPRTKRYGGQCDIAADIGTTTIAMALVDNSGNLRQALTKNNSQRAFGADVLSRIRYANSGGAVELKRLIWRDLLAGIESLKEQALKKQAGDIRIGRLLISANTTMEHLLMGDSCERLGTAPFIPATLELRKYRLTEIIENVPGYCTDTELIILPGISAFIGADIVTGMYACGMEQIENNTLFIDLGTNGEMVLGTTDGYLATSVAAGPAFEGGNITCGCPGIDGAICGISMMGKRSVIKTIGNKPPVGICGTGVVELSYEMVKTGMADTKGTFSDDYHREGLPVAQTPTGSPIVFTQSDMRQIQMAKAAVRAGIELLLQEKKLTAKDITEVYLAGGFGYQINVYKAAGIGLLPGILREKTKALGNTSLQGAMKYLTEKNAAGHLQKMIAATSEINLAEHPAFEQTYLSYMNF